MMSVKVLGIPFRWLYLDLCDLLKIVLVVETISENVAEVPKCSFQGVRRTLLLGLFEGCSFAFAVLDLAIADVLEWSARCFTERTCPTAFISPREKCRL